MNGSIAVKQADVILDTYPLNYQKNYNVADALRDLDYYAGKQSLNGPGMTYAIFSIVASQVSPSGCSAYTYQQYSSQPYSRAPWFQDSEQLIDDYATNGGTHPAYPFLTGHGGANQVTIFGYLGLRLTPDLFLHVNPSLPPQIPYLRYRTFYWQGWPISAVANQTHTTLTRLNTPYIDANMMFKNKSIPVQIGNDKSKIYDLPPMGMLTLPNRPQGLIKTIPGNIAQCLPITSPNEFLPGQFPISAVDGASSTKWQPTVANKAQTVTVDLSSQPYEPVSMFHFDWAQNPPKNISVYFHNASSYDISTAALRTTVTISNPYDASKVALITPYTSNTTNITLPSPVWSGRYATLAIQGNLGDPAENATGASVAEWVIIGSSGGRMKSRSVDAGRREMPVEFGRLLARRDRKRGV